MVANGRDKVIQVQKPAQSLQAFQKKVASGDDLQVGYLKPLLIGAGAAVVAVGVFFAVQAARSSTLARHNEAVANLKLEVGGNPAAPGLETASPQELETRMRERLPRLETLANSAPSGAKAATTGLLATWRAELGEQGPAPAAPTDPWGLLRLAQKQVALGQGKEAAASLAPLRGKADPDQAWGSLYWSTLLDADRLQGDRDQAWKDLAEYKTRFRDQADASLDRLLAGV
jgi:hypothetical protein